jgi:hypothetical protein
MSSTLVRPLRVVALLSALALPGVLHAQHLNGLVLDKASGTPIRGASISLVPVEAKTAVVSVATDSVGEFTLTGAAPGTYRLLVRNGTLAPTETYVFWLGPLTEHQPVLRLETVGRQQDSLELSIKGLPNTDWTHDFYTRKRTTHGIFLTRADVASRGALLATDWLFGVRGVAVQTVGGRSRLVARSAGRSCVMEVWVDNLPVLEGDLNQVLRADDIAAVEVYPDAGQAPVRFQSRSCGSVLVWSRAGRGDADMASVDAGAVKTR